MKKYKVAIIGLGMVGLMYDHLSNSNETCYSHSKAFSMRSDVFDLYGVDPNINCLDVFEKAGYGQGFTSLDQVDELGLDIYVLSIETPMHYELASKILRLQPRLLLVEKPISYKVEDSRDLIFNAEQTSVPIFVNYFRRSLPQINEIKDIINKSKFQKCSCHFFYSGGIFNIASHFIDLLIYFFGDLTVSGSKIKKKLKSDFLVEFFLENEIVEATFIPLDVNYKFFEMTMFFDDFRVTMDSFGELNIFRKGGHIILNTGEYLTPYKVMNADVYMPQKYVVDNLCNYLSVGSGNLCPGREALKTEELIYQILGRG